VELSVLYVTEVLYFKYSLGGKRGAGSKKGAEEVLCSLSFLKGEKKGEGRGTLSSILVLNWGNPYKFHSNSIEQKR